MSEEEKYNDNEDTGSPSRPKNCKLDYLQRKSRSSIPPFTWYRYQKKYRDLLLNVNTQASAELIHDVHEFINGLEEDIDEEEPTKQYYETEHEEHNYFEKPCKDDDLPINIEEENTVNKEYL
ncbi:uncharacterized protein LOC117174879 [Belonocnema kinseyi]|uniref:uncharacterized protein LOC117174879 n=1 Tax=Belonocnema kinseyi TaxID=2817044 RepID=UPI00143CFB88|nr:uncharacterized protein LOC117174879 [Belonocnema kinseyi]